MNEWELKDGEQEFEIPSQPVNPMTPDRFKKLREEADKKMIDMYLKMKAEGMPYSGSSSVSRSVV